MRTRPTVEMGMAMNLREVRRLAMIALTLYCLPTLGWYFVMLLPAASYGGISYIVSSAVIPLAFLAVLVWLTARCSNAVGRIFTPPSLDGAALVGCVALRVLCLREIVVGCCAAGQWATMALIAGGGFSGLGMRWEAWLAYFFFVPCVSLMLFFLAAPMARWIVGQVDSGVMWWSPIFRWLTR